MKALEGIAQIIPFLIKGTLFIFVDLPKYIFGVIKSIGNFIKKSIPVLFAVILTFMLVFFGLQIIISKVMDTPGMIPHIPLAAFSLFIVYELVTNEYDLLKSFQKKIFDAFLFIFANPLLKDILGFDVKVDSKNPLKSMPQILKWIGKNILKIILFLFFILLIGKISYQKIWGYITFYTNKS